MAKKTIYPGTRGWKNKVLKMPIDLTGMNKVPIVGYIPWVKVRLGLPGKNGQKVLFEWGQTLGVKDYKCLHNTFFSKVD